MKPMSQKGPFLQCIKIRYIQVLLLAVLAAVLVGSKLLPTIAILAMTTPNSSCNPEIPVYNWTNTSIILSSIYWGYALSPLLAGWIIQKQGPKRYLLASILVDSTVNCLVPTVAEKFGADGLIFCRIAQGVAQGFGDVCFTNLLGRWAPTNERTSLVAVYEIGGSVGAIVAKFLTGFVAASWLGWPVMFYGFGFMGIIFASVYLWVGSNTPANHPYISEEERKYIEESLGQQDSPQNKVRRIPWKAIMTSLPYWAIIVTITGTSWGTTLLSTELPTYLSKVVNLDIKKSATFSTAPYLMAIVSQASYAFLLDFLINKGYTSRANARRVFHGTGTTICGISLTLITFVPNTLTYVEFFFILCYMSKSVLQHTINAIDISPRYVGILLSIAGVLSQCVGLFAPICVQFVVYDQTNADLWRIVFVFTGIFYIATGAFFVAFMSSDRQWWDAVADQKNEGKNASNGNSTISNEERKDISSFL